MSYSQQVDSGVMVHCLRLLLRTFYWKIRARREWKHVALSSGSSQISTCLSLLQLEIGFCLEAFNDPLEFIHTSLHQKLECGHHLLLAFLYT